MTAQAPLHAEAGREGVPGRRPRGRRRLLSIAEMRVGRDDSKRRVDTLLDELATDRYRLTSERLTIRLSAFDVSIARSVTT
jgi:hypothetical protein